MLIALAGEIAMAEAVESWRTSVFINFVSHVEDVEIVGCHVDAGVLAIVGSVENASLAVPGSGKTGPAEHLPASPTMFCLRSL